jgi:hypothetical protein
MGFGLKKPMMGREENKRVGGGGRKSLSRRG